jgi:threonine dehydrogenase-like Zn-dependent dehydrogenase
MRGTTIRYNNDGSIDLVEVEVADPGAGEIQVAGGVCGICSWDIVTAKLGDRMKPMAPPGHEGMGHVVKVGPNVAGFEEGDRVAGGGFATLRNLPVSRAYKLPTSDLDDKYWVVEPVSCVVTGLDHCRLRPSDRVVVIGCGFMGLMLLQGLLHSFAEQVIAVDIVPERLELAKKLGAAEVYNAAQEDVAELAQSLKARQIDVVVDSTGSQAGLDLAVDVVKRGGLINLFGWIKGQTATFDPTKWHIGGFTLVNSSPSSQIRDPFPPAIQLIHKGIIDLRPLVTHVAPLQEYPGLMGQILAGDKGYVKGVVTLS